MKRAQARDNELPSEASEVRYMVYALDAATGKIKWEREAIRTTPFGGRHRKNTYASETPFTDGERLYASFGQNVGLFCYTLDGKLLWKSQWKPQTDLPRLRHGVVANRVRRPRLSAAGQRRGLVAHRARRQDRQADLAHAAATRPDFPKSSWMTPFVWKNALRTEIVTTGHGCVISYDLDGTELWRVTGMSMPTAVAVVGRRPALRRHRRAGRRQSTVPRDQAGASGRHLAESRARDSNAFIAWSQSARLGLHAVGAGARRPRLSGARHRHPDGPQREDGRADLQGARRRRRPHVLGVAGRRRAIACYLLTEEGVTFVLDAGDEYKEIAHNDLCEMSLASPAVAGDAIYIRTESKLYKIAN